MPAPVAIFAFTLGAAPAGTPRWQLFGPGGAVLDFATNAFSLAPAITQADCIAVGTGGLAWACVADPSAWADAAYPIAVVDPGSGFATLIDPAANAVAVAGGAVVGGGGTVPDPDPDPDPDPTPTGASWLPLGLFGGAGRWLMGPAAALEVVVAAPPGRDDLILLDAVARLEATGAFGAVQLVHADPREQALPASEAAVAWVYLESWSEADEDSDADLTLRDLRFAVFVACREQEPCRRARELGRLAAVACNAINGRSLAGLTLPARTRLAQGAAGRGAAHPQAATRHAGRAAYWVQGDDGMDESEILEP